MGAPQVWFELSGMLKDKQWDDMMADFGVFYNLSQEERIKSQAGPSAQSGLNIQS